MIRIGNKTISDNSPVFIVAEIGINHNGDIIDAYLAVMIDAYLGYNKHRRIINHNGDINLAKKLIDVAAIAGCDAVKFQKRNPPEAVPEEYKNVKRETPWGLMTYLEYREKLEFGRREYDEIDMYCKKKNIIWTASPWDMSSIEFLEEYNLLFSKIPSALITNREYLERLKKNNTPLMVSTGMADIDLVRKVVSLLGEENIVLLHTVSTYPTKVKDINLNVIKTYKNLFKCPVGYSGHEVGLQITLAAVASGAKVIERHITLDRSLWGTDQAASVETVGLIKLVRDIRIIEEAMGTGKKNVVPEELELEKKLRKVYTL